MLLLWLSA